MIHCHNLTLGYDRHPVIHHFEAKISSGQMLAIVGGNGTGKSTLLKAIMGQLKPLEGSVDYPGINIKAIAYLPQIAQLDRSFPITVQEMVSSGLWLRTGAFRSLRTLFTRQSVKEVLKKTGLQGFEQRTLQALSGGQLQRVLFARMLLQNADLILLDEPFTGVDHATTQHLLTILHDLNCQGKTILAVLHDPALVKEHFPQTLLLQRGPEPCCQAVIGQSEWVLDHYLMKKADIQLPLPDETAQVCQQTSAAYVISEPVTEGNTPEQQTQEVKNA
ncbi:ABC transporter ATP-binding protein [Oceanospirillum sp. D5]|uniref:ABC transporter ATP-binding protein n=1 Tax=Oceanospirillum sediminis TaxID=2760088 RepID=A0A839IPL2_9GAMM|nr:ABC transporter ATP-binding protein [Oceanospirillum sediminis]